MFFVILFSFSSCVFSFSFFFFFNAPAPTEIYTLSLHDALPISRPVPGPAARARWRPRRPGAGLRRSEEHTSELQSRSDLVCRLLLEKKKKKKNHNNHMHINNYSTLKHSPTAVHTHMHHTLRTLN